MVDKANLRGFWRSLGGKEGLLEAEYGRDGLMNQ